MHCLKKKRKLQVQTEMSERGKAVIDFKLKQITWIRYLL